MMSRTSILFKRYFILLLAVIAVSLPALCQNVCRDNISVCQNVPPFALTGSSPSGGIYSGTGVSSGNFNPSLAGLGVNTITYATVDGNNQSTTCTFTITVNAAPEITCDLSIGQTCGDVLKLEACPAWISTGETLEKIWTGPGVTGSSATGYSVDPSVSGPGLHQFTLTVTTQDGCSATATHSDFIDDKSEVSCPSDMTMSVTDPPFVLTGAVVINGTYGVNPSMYPNDAWYAGVGVNSETSVFSPSVAGEGIHTISYNYDLPCPATCTFRIRTSPLPVKLKYLGAKLVEGNVQIDWETASEVNFDFFELQKSASPEKGFLSISKQHASPKNTYSFTDDGTHNSIKPFYYRLKMVDQDDTFAFSKIVQAPVQGAMILSVFPNPASKEINIESAIAITELSVISRTGKEVFKTKLPHVKNKKLSLPSLLPGLYLLKIKSADGNDQHSKLLVE